MLCVCKVTATDLDSVTNSQLTYSVSDNSFSVQTLNNIGYIKTARYVSIRLTFSLRASTALCIAANNQTNSNDVIVRYDNKLCHSPA